MKKAGKILLVIACVIGVAVGGVRLVPPRKRTGRTGGSHAPGHAEPEYQRGGHHIRATLSSKAIRAAMRDALAKGAAN